MREGAPQDTLSDEAGGSAGGSDGGSAGGVSSETVTSKLPEVALPEPSVAVHVTFVVPTGNVEPEAGRQSTDGDGSTMSSAAGFVQVTAAPPGSVVDADGDGSAPSPGAVVSTTWTENEPFVVTPPESVAEQSTVVVPSGNRLPDAGSQATARVRIVLGVGRRGDVRAEPAARRVPLDGHAGREVELRGRVGHDREGDLGHRGPAGPAAGRPGERDPVDIVRARGERSGRA